MMLETEHKRKRNIFMAIFSFMTILLVYSAFFRQTYILDMLVVSAFFTILYYTDKAYRISSLAFKLVFTAIILHLIGIMGIYSEFLFGFLTFDKLVHLASAFSVTYLLLEISSEKRIFLKYATVILAVTGLGAIIEINEFIGSSYFGVDNLGIFAMGAAEPKTDLQKYDTYFDMIFNLAGSFISAAFASWQGRRVLETVLKTKKKKKDEAKHANRKARPIESRIQKLAKAEHLMDDADEKR